MQLDPQTTIPTRMVWNARATAAVRMAHQRYLLTLGEVSELVQACERRARARGQDTVQARDVAQIEFLCAAAWQRAHQDGSAQRIVGR